MSQFNVLGKGGNAARAAKKDLPRNIAIRLDRIEPAADGKPSQFHGYSIEDGSPITVRMMTAVEGVAVNSRAKETYEETLKRIEAQYQGSGEKHRPKPSEISNSQHKAHCQSGGVLQFTKCLRNDDGSFRAHWVETLEKYPGGGFEKVVATVKVFRDENNKDSIKKIVAEVLATDKAVILTGDNAIKTLSSVFAPQGSDGVKRSPFMTVRLIDQAGRVVLNASVSAKYKQEDKVDPDTGATFKHNEVCTAAESIQNLFAHPSDPNARVTNDQMIVRAALHPFRTKTDAQYPEFKGVSNDSLLEDLKKVTDGVRAGTLKVEVIPGERVAAGPSTRASMEKAYLSNPNHPLRTAYVRVIEPEKEGDPKTYETLYQPTFLSTRLLAEDSGKFFTKVMPAELYAKGLSMSQLSTNNDFASSAEASRERVQEQVNVPDEVPEVPDFSLPEEDVNKKLSDSVAELNEF